MTDEYGSSLLQESATAHWTSASLYTASGKTL